MKNKGFTLIELLVVIAIISLLSSVVLAVVNDARDKAKARALESYMHQIVNALELYKSDNSTYLSGRLSETNFFNQISAYIQYDQKIMESVASFEYLGSDYILSSCGIGTESPYAIVFNLQNTAIELNFPLWYEQGTPNPGYFSENDYCVSIQ